jgi:hypothetical protein
MGKIYLGGNGVEIEHHIKDIISHGDEGRPGIMRFWPTNRFWWMPVGLARDKTWLT